MGGGHRRFHMRQDGYQHDNLCVHDDNQHVGYPAEQFPVGVDAADEVVADYDVVAAGGVAAGVDKGSPVLAIGQQQVGQLCHAAEA